MINKFTFRLSLTILLFTIASGLGFAQDSRNVNAKNFNNISVSSGIDLFLTQGNTENVTIKGREEIIKDVIIEQNGTQLTIKYKRGVNWSSLFRNSKINVYITYKKLNTISASGGSDVKTENTLNTDILSITASGGSDISLSVKCKDLSISASGGSDIDLEGNAENMQLNASGGSDVDAFNLKANYAKVSASGGSDINVNVEKGLEANATSGSDVKYRGNASLKKTSNSKSSDVTHVN
ncbi:head GIN domain-containing protein [Pedobacter sp.]|uniref:head GIN domain-containing protein n=1 Tax=Pedobacter sp. TaxID=1411316 RepID=UPI00396C82C7